MDSKDIFQIVPFTPSHGFEVLAASGDFSSVIEGWREFFEAAEKEGPACTVLKDSMPVACLGLFIETGSAWLINKTVSPADLFVEAVRTFFLVSAKSNGLATLYMRVESMDGLWGVFLKLVGFEYAGFISNVPAKAILMKFDVVE